MFEREAEEYADKSNWLFPQSKELAKEFWQKGSEFGYNKANEWHFVKDGDLPKDEFVDEYRKSRLPSAYKRHYCLYLGDNESVMGKYIKGFFSTVEGRYSLDEVVAWKEIVLPIELRK